MKGIFSHAHWKLLPALIVLPMFFHFFSVIKNMSILYYKAGWEGLGDPLAFITLSGAWMFFSYGAFVLIFGVVYVTAKSRKLGWLIIGSSVVLLILYGAAFSASLLKII